MDQIVRWNCEWYPCNDDYIFVSIISLIVLMSFLLTLRFAALKDPARPVSPSDRRCFFHELTYSSFFLLPI